MKQKIKIVFGTLFLLIFSLQGEDLINTRLLAATKMSALIGTTIVNNDHHKVGKIKDFVIDTQSGRVLLVVVSSSGIWGWNEKLTAVVPQVLHYDSSDKIVHLTTERGSIIGAPLFWISSWTEQTKLAYLSKAYRFFNKEGALNFVEVSNLDPNDFSLRTDNKTTISKRNPDGTWTSDEIANHSSTRIPMARMSTLQRASQVLGMDVQSLQRESIGKVDDVLIDLSTGRIVVIMIGDKRIFDFANSQRAIPPTILHYDQQKQSLILGASKEIFMKTPSYQGDQWPDFSQITMANVVYQQYQMIPYYTEPVVTQVDNTEKNRRDQTGLTITPLDQGTSPADISTTQKIRKAVVSSKEISMNGKNIKIITIEGQVTLRGPVSSEEEKLLIGKIADQIAKEENVDNQLESKLSMSKIN